MHLKQISFLSFFFYIIFSLFSAYCSVLSVNSVKEIKFSTFRGTDKHIQLNGEAEIQVDTFSEGEDEKILLRLVPRKSNADGLVAGSAFLKIPFVGPRIGSYAFSTFFRFRITANNIYDGSGIVFVIQSDKRKTKALAKQKGGMGFAGDFIRDAASITPSLGVKFDVQLDELKKKDIDYNSIGVLLNGSLESMYPPYGYPIAERQLNNGLPWNVWIDYDGYLLSVRTTQETRREYATEHTKRPINLSSIMKRNLGKTQIQPEVFVGFTADPGFFPAYHDILEWHFRPYYKPYGDYCGDDKDISESCETFLDLSKSKIRTKTRKE